MVGQVRTPNILGAFMAGEQGAQRLRMTEEDNRRRNMLADMSVRQQEFSEMDANRNFEFREEGRDYQRQQAEAVAARAAAAMAARERATIQANQREELGRRLGFVAQLPGGQKLDVARQLGLADDELAPLIVTDGATGEQYIPDLAWNTYMVGMGYDAPAAAQPDYSFINAGGTVVRTDAATGAAEPVFTPPPEAKPGFRLLTQEEVAATPGLDPNRAYQVSPQGQISAVGGGGMGLRVSPDGAVEFGTNVKFTEGQAKDNVYYTRASGALPVIDQFEAALTSLPDQMLGADPTGIARGAFQSQDYQVARAAGLEFLLSILRKDTGAAVTVPEEQLYGSLYLPQPGDGPDVIAYKRDARRRALAAIAAGMSPAQMAATERARQIADFGGASPATPSTGDRRDGAGGRTPPPSGGPRILSVEPVR